MLSLVHSMAMATPDHPTRAVYFAAIMMFKAHAAVIEVTAGGVGGTEPTYRFSDLSGTPVATLIGNVSNGDITASGDLKTGSGNRVDAMATMVGVLQAEIASLKEMFLKTTPPSYVSSSSAAVQVGNSALCPSGTTAFTAMFFFRMTAAQLTTTQ